MMQTKCQHETRLLKIAVDHISWMEKFQFDCSLHFRDLKREMLHNLMNRDYQPLY